MAISALGPLSRFDTFQFKGTSKRAHWKSEKHGVYFNCVDGVICGISLEGVHVICEDEMNLRRSIETHAWSHDSILIYSAIPKGF